MNRKVTTGLVLTSMLAAVSVFAVATPAQAATVKYKNCAAIQKLYPLGAGIKGAKDKIKGTGTSKVTKFKVVSKAVYDKNKKLDTDKDKILCESIKYTSCKYANAVYPHGAGLKGAKDKSTKPVTTFKVVTNAIYQTNEASLDRDNDKIFCEKL